MKKKNKDKKHIKAKDKKKVVKRAPRRAAKVTLELGHPEPVGIEAPGEAEPFINDAADEPDAVEAA